MSVHSLPSAGLSPGQHTHEYLMNEMKVITKKYTKKSVIKGARKLLIKRKNAGEE